MSCIMISSLSAATLSGNVVDAETGDILIGANISIYKNGELQTGAVSDLDGEYFIKMLDPVIYDVEISYIGYETLTIEGVSLTVDRQNDLMVELTKGVNLIECVILEYKIPLVEDCSIICCGFSNCYGPIRERKEEKPELEEVDEVIASVNYYPNPTTDFLHVVLTQTTESITIRSMNGKELFSQFNLSEGIVKLDVSTYVAGTYILQVVGNEQMMTKKFIVIRE